MELSLEQKDIIRTKGSFKINAVAGSGKTTTLIHYALTLPPDSRILYLAFNKTVKEEAVKKFGAADLHNVRVETAHSLAHKHIVYRSAYKVRDDYKPHEIISILGLEPKDYVLASHVLKFFTFFCNSDVSKVTDLDYAPIVMEGKPRNYVRQHYTKIEQALRIFLKKMNDAEVEILHDFYLKKFQLSKKKLPYDYILFDEAQDASAAMLDIIFCSDAQKIIVGDINQQIYGWRYAVNALDKIPLPLKTLSASFRFSSGIAMLAQRALMLKQNIYANYTPVAIEGKGKNKLRISRAVLARTNLALLIKAIDILEEEPIKRIYFEGNLNSYTYAEAGASLYDVLYLVQGKQEKIKDHMLRSMAGADELQNYLDQTDDVQLRLMLEVVKKYGDGIWDIMKDLKQKHVKAGSQHEAEIIFSTVHRAKGMEYDIVELCEDFITEKKMKTLMEDFGGDPLIIARINEEVNLLYVALTRAKSQVLIPPGIVPPGFTKNAHIQFIQRGKPPSGKASDIFKRGWNK